MTRAVYISHNAVGTALVRSQVLPYLRDLALHGVDAQLITFERTRPRFPHGEFSREKWVGINARPGTSLIAKALDVLAGLWIVRRLVLRNRADVLHARSYLPAAIALASGTLTRRPFVFDMRGFLGDEYVDIEYWRTTELRYRILRIVERMLLQKAGEIVVLSQAAAQRLRRDPEYAKHTRRKRITVIPAAVDVERFRPQPSRSSIPTLVYAGSVGTWYKLDEMLRVYVYARRLEPRLRFLILNQHEHRLIDDAVARIGLRDAPVEVRSADFGEMPDLLASAHVGILLLQQGNSKTASSPIKVGEYLASGLPVVINAGVGDTDALICRYRAGHVVPSYSDDALQEAGRALVDLLGDERARGNARGLAEAEFDLRNAAADYAAVYERLARRSGGRPV